MHSFQPSAAAPSRPTGPRSIHRPSSPSNPALYNSSPLPQIAPLNIRKVSAQKPKLPKIDFRNLTVDEGPFLGGYAGGPQPPSNGSATAEAPGEPTIMPRLTISPQPRVQPPPVVSIENIRQTMEDFDQYSDDTLEELARLGEGASGAVYKVRDRRTGLVMARKTITTLEAPLKQLLREIKITSSTSHRNIIHFYGAYISPSSSEVKVVMEFCEGGSLESVGKRMKELGACVSEKVAGRLAEGILQGLNYLHSKKTIHRDIKPPNILLTREGVVKLCDFGVSGELVNSMAGTFTGTSLYMAPERLSGEEYTIRSDVWSTGISLLELVKNRFPFPTDLAAIELMMYITQNEPPELEDDDDIIWSDEMKDFIKAALTRDATRRPTPKDMLEHPWIKNIMQYEVNMAYWMRKVWNWPKPPRTGVSSEASDRRRSGDGASRPSSSRGDAIGSLDASMSSLSLGATPAV